MGERLELRTLGGLNIQRGGVPVTGFDSRKVAALLIYLACTRREHPREVLAEMLWEERTQAQALSNLRVALHSLNQIVGEYVETPREAVGLNPAAEVWLDVAEFETLLSAAGSDTARLDAALEHYRGDFLAGFFVDSSAYEQWATRERERLRLRAMEGLDTLITGHLAGANYPEGIRRATQLLQMDPLREETYRQMMHLLALSGQRAKALEVYETCRRLLEDEFGLTPLPQTLALYEQLRAGELTPDLSPGTHEVESISPFYALVENPYKGLCAFDEADEADFFGREGLVERVLARLAEQHPLSRFLAVVGPSGSGKSSVVRAGLIPALRRGGLPGSAAWPIVTLLPGGLPFDELEIALRRAAPHAPPTLIDDLRRDARGLLRAARLCLSDEQQEMVLVIDQFEEVFTLVSDSAEARRFLDCLYLAATSPRSPLRILITLRADFYDRPLMIPDFSELVRQRTEVITPMTPDELERAVAAPAQRVGVQVEPALLAAVVAEISQQPGALPMMEYALTEVFERRTDHTLTLATYESIGGALGALARRANEIYDHLNDERQAAARQMCLRLVTPGEGTEDTRRRTLQTELISAGGDATRAVLHAFDRARLLTFDRDPRSYQPTVELAHEAIIREWTLLRAWLDESRDDVRLQRQLSAAAADWQQAGEETSYLLSGARLTQFEEWAQSSSVALTREEDAYLDASVTEQRRQDILERERQAHELVLQKRAANRLRYLVAGLAVFLLAALALSIFAFGQRNQAQDARATSDANALLAEAKAAEAQELALVNGAQAALATGDIETALALAVAANSRPDPSGQAQTILSQAAYQPGPIRRFVPPTGGTIIRVALSPDGRRALSGGNDNLAILWDLETGQIIYRFDQCQGWVVDVEISPDGRIGMGISRDLLITLWDLETGKMLRQFGRDLILGPEGLAATFSPDGRYILSNNGGAKANQTEIYLVLWDVETGKMVRQFKGHSTWTYGVAFTPDGKHALSTARMGEMIVWDVETGEILRQFNETTTEWRRVSSDITFSPNGNVAYAAGMDCVLVAWDLETFTPLHQWGTGLAPDSSGWCNAQVAVSPDGNRVMIHTSAWDTRTGALIMELPSGVGTGLGTAFRPDGSTVLTSGNEMRLWDVRVGAETWRWQFPGSDLGTFAVNSDQSILLAADFFQFQSARPCQAYLYDITSGQELRRWNIGPEGPDCLTGAFRVAPNDRIGAGAINGQILRFDLENGEQLDGLDAHAGTIYSLRFSPDSRTLLAGYSNGLLVLWDAITGQEVRRFVGHESYVWAVEFGPDGQTVVSSAGDGQVIQWDTATGQPVRHLTGHIGGVNAITFSADGRMVIGGDDGGQITFWDSSSGSLVRAFSGVADYIYLMTMLPDGHTLLCFDGYNIAFLIDTTSGEVIRRYPAPASDGGLVDAGSQGVWGFDNAGIFRWRTDSLEGLMSWTLSHRYVRELTCEERALYQIDPRCDAEKEFPTRTPYPTPSAAAVTGALVPGQIAAVPTTPTLTVTPRPLTEALVGEQRGQVAVGDVQLWQFAGHAGETLTIRVSADAPANWGTRSEGETPPDGGWLDTVVLVLDPNDTPLNMYYDTGGYPQYDPVQSDDIDSGVNTDSLVEGLVLPTDGTYVIEVSGANYRTGGAYTLTIDSLPPGMATATPAPEN